jgi:fucose permease
MWADDWAASFHFTGVGHAALAACAAFVRFPSRELSHSSHAPDDESIQRSDRSGERRVLSGAMIPFAGIAFAYVGIETSLVVFAIPYSAEFGLSAAIGRTAISAFWMGLLIGRLSVLVRRSPPDAGVLLTAGALGSVLLAAGVGLGFARVDALFGVLGFAFGSVYPVNMALTGQRFSRARGAAAGVAAGAGALGGFAVPWWTGAVADSVGIGAALLSLTGFTLMIAFLSASLRRTS